jgi:ketosteroid isomerase-like protein
MRFSLAALGAAAGCRSTTRSAFTSTTVLAPSTDAEEAHDGLLRSDLSRTDTVARRGLVAGLGALFTDDVIYLRGGLPLLKGRESASAVIGADTAAAAASVRWQPVRAEVSSDRRSGYSYGYSVYALRARAENTIRIDRYIAFWRKERGAWRISAYAETYSAAPANIPLPDVAGRGVLADVVMSPRGGALDAIRLADAAFSSAASTSGTGEAFGRYAARDAQVFSAPGEFITGPEAIRDSFGPPSGKNSLVWHPVEGEMAGSGDLGFTVGNAVFTDSTAGSAQPLVQHSKYLTVWKRQRDGTWKYVVDGGSSRPRN